MSKITRTSDIRDIVRSEIKKYVLREFTDTEDFVCDMHLLSDDLSAVALSIEKRLNVRVDRSKYSQVHNITDFVIVLEFALQSIGNSN